MTTDQQVRYSSNVEIAKELLDLDGKKVVDVGCGEGRFTRFLAKAGAEVTGIDINQTALDRAIAKSLDEGVDVAWKNARAEAMPFKDGELDIVVFSNSFHHVAPERMADALNEAGRTLNPDGVLYIMEPVAAGDYFEATRFVNDESEVRNLAIGAIQTLARGPFDAVEEVTYHSQKAYENFEAYADEQSLRGEKRKKIFEDRGPEIKEKFVAAAQKEDGKLCFDQIFRINLLKKPT